METTSPARWNLTADRKASSVSRSSSASTETETVRAMSTGWEKVSRVENCPVEELEEEGREASQECLEQLMAVGGQSGLVNTVSTSSLSPLTTFTSEAWPSPQTLARPGDTKTLAKASLGESAGLREDWGTEVLVVQWYLLELI